MVSRNGNLRSHGSVKYTAGKIGGEKKLPGKRFFMDTFAKIHNVDRLNRLVMLLEENSKIHANHHPTTLDDVQRRACEIHHKHGAVNGGYTLDEWLEAEHEMEET